MVKENGADVDYSVLASVSRVEQDNNRRPSEKKNRKKKTRVSADSHHTKAAPTSQARYVATPPEDNRRRTGHYQQSDPTECNQPDLVRTASAMSVGITNALSQITGLTSLFPNVDQQYPPPRSGRKQTKGKLSRKQQAQKYFSQFSADGTLHYTTGTEEKKDDASSIDTADEESASENERLPPPQLFDSRLPARRQEAPSPNSSSVALHKPVPLQAGAGSSASVRNSPISTSSSNIQLRQVANLPVSTISDDDDDQWYLKSSPMARMRDQATQRASTLDEDVSTPSSSARKSHEQIKAEKQRKWKRRMKIAQKKKRQERRELEDEADDTDRTGGGFVELVLANVVPATDEAFFGLIQTRCGSMDDAQSDSEDYSGYSSSAVSSDLESRLSEATSRPRNDKRRGTPPDASSAEVLYSMNSKQNLQRSQGWSDSSQRSTSSSFSSAQNHSPMSEDISMPCSTYQDPGQSGEHRLEASREKSPPRTNQAAEKSPPRDPSPRRYIPTTPTDDDRNIAPVPSLPSPVKSPSSVSFSSVHSVITSPPMPHDFSLEGEALVQSPPKPEGALDLGDKSPERLEQIILGHSAETSTKLLIQPKLSAPSEPPKSPPSSTAHSSPTELTSPESPSIRSPQHMQAETKPNGSLHGLESPSSLEKEPSRNSRILEPNARETEPSVAETPTSPQSQHRTDSSVTTENSSVHPGDKIFVKAFIEEVISRGIRLLWHREQASMSPSIVKMHLKRGYRTPTRDFCGPRLAWVDIEDPGNKFGIDLFDIKSLDKATPMNLREYPFAIPSRSIFLKLTRDRDFVFEANSGAEAGRIIHGFRWLVARLAFNLVIGNLEVSCELLDVGLLADGTNRQRTPQTPLEEARWTKAMDDLTKHLVDKSSVS